jgi:hypothetical protein
MPDVPSEPRCSPLPENGKLLAREPSATAVQNAIEGDVQNENLKVRKVPDIIG